MTTSYLTLASSAHTIPTAANDVAIAKRFSKWTEEAATMATIADALQDEIRSHRDTANVPSLDRVVQYAIATPRKMLRGWILLEACKAVGGDPEKVLPAAVAAEFGHIGSSIHEEILDSHEARGRQPVWRKYGVENAIRAGDLFLFYASRSLSKCRECVGADRVVRAFEVLSQARIEQCRARAREAHGDMSRAEYMSVAKDKTGSLFRAAAESGAILGGGTDERIAAVRGYAESLGVAHPIIDDIVSCTADGPIPVNPLTLPILYALETGNEQQRAILRDVLEADWADEAEARSAQRKVRAILEQTGAIGRARADALALLDEALVRLSALPANNGTSCLQMIAHMVMHRSRQG